jgi:SAM-dependent methyltransferase
MPVTREDVLLAYRQILGREPENEAVVAEHMTGTPNRNVLRLAFLRSPEMREVIQGGLPATLPLAAPPLPIELTADPETLARLLRFTGAYWEEIGRTAPHWSVLTAAEYKPESIAENEARFFASGAGEAELVQAVLARAGRSAAEFRSAAEYGCGVGRITMHLARLFPRVQALDISPPHLAVAREVLSREGIGNVDFHQVTADNLHPAEGFDFWFSRIVLQHNPPPIIMAILERVFALLAPGGVAIFQVPTYHVGYSFSVADYLGKRLGEEMEMHMVPQGAVLEAAWRHGCRLLEMREDTPVVSNSPRWLSNLYAFTKVA